MLADQPEWISELRPRRSCPLGVGALFAAASGTRRHDHGEAADLYVYDPQGNRLTGDRLTPLAQHWLAMKQGSVGLEMAGGGIHLDEHEAHELRRGEGLQWGYCRRTRAQMQAIRTGLAGVPPTYANVDFAETRKRVMEGERSAAAGRVDVNGGVKVDVSFRNTPPGTKTSAKTEGNLLKKVTLDRGQAMTRAEG